ncbi:adenylate kinase [Gregarina niphandrodes]|uniref:Adenylate kinase n=1 Tax=Gregarina niphandrodes TaxID=110365 RepID=A0A023B542_GRENI|nr:adenylate kinase [Gregarina niphandrodes]EZG58464.1 adenylate kinase [Gregarina niphandrodes]|eukprot:XP_011130963.1 adenylate kinase [Gregarina niphandrodes]
MFEKVETYKLLAELRSRASRVGEGKLNILLFGAPGCGKGTHSEWLKAEMGLCHISTGDALREEIASGSELGKKVEGILTRGELVDDQTVLDIVAGKMARNPKAPGYLLDGYPRTLEQARSLDALLAEKNSRITAVLYFKASEDTLKFRICGRRIHKASGRTYHVVNKPPKVEGKDDVTGEDLMQRPDDNEQSLVTRLKTFYEQTAPLLDYYGEQHILNTFNADEEAASVKRDVQAVLKIGGQQ